MRIIRRDQASSDPIQHTAEVVSLLVERGQIALRLNVISDHLPVDGICFVFTHIAPRSTRDFFERTICGNRRDRG